jgi:Flp pilus assembly protein TadD
MGPPAPSQGAADAALVATYKRLHEAALSPAVWRQTAREFACAGDLPRARQALQTLLTSNPEDLAAHLQLAEMLLLDAGSSSSSRGSRDAVTVCQWVGLG